MGDIVAVGSKKLRKVLVFMSWVQSQMNLNRKDAFFTTTHYDSNLSPLIFPSPSLPNPRTDYPKDSISTPSPPSSGGGGAKINPVVIFIIVILAVVFFISGLLHLLVRFLMKHRSSSSSVSESNSYPELSGSDTVQRQLQQLFHLHDLGLDQAFVDALPVFFYKEIMGLKEPFDCAVCLCEFSEQDKLRLLPNCSHAFHIDCIDTWLLSNSTCPLCRGTLFTPGLAFENPLFHFEDSREEDGLAGHGEAIGGAGGVSSGYKPAESEVICGKRVFSVILGKFRNSNEAGNGEVGETSSSYLDARRCFSMGSCQYVVADSELQVALKPSNGGGASVRLVNVNSVVTGDIEGKRISNIGSKGESFSVSKIWQWSRKGKFPSPSQTRMGVGAGTGFDYSWTDRNQKT